MGPMGPITTASVGRGGAQFIHGRWAMRYGWLLVAGGLLLAAGGPAAGQDKLDKYLTKDGKLTRTLVVQDLQSGFAGVTGREYRVEPSGEWTVGQVFQSKVK